ncbi:tripartite tricarboxylate transporter TctB family protein [Halomonas sp. DP1Y21-3]|uniref:tripartite tricarboxylate transporter TctB family protein n=1 Tax=Halomonas sp. DP1Y21-3 TaxID=2859080 RepID=UPI001C97C49F|nr:tripartite tricarboxylate transporter TctB family protein [Halomonas sp. DP1Y21-3]MBY6112045.1 tripartite tricarboxylate transporter TctB family protein [Halomonas sp. DP1Y21-3]
MKLSRLLFGLFALGVATLFGVTSLGYPDAAARMPLIYAVVVGLFAIAMIVQELTAHSRARAQASSSAAPTLEGSQLAEGELTEGDSAPAPPAPPARPLKAMAVFVFAAVYIYSISWLGYVVATAVFMGLSLWLVRHVSLRFSLIGIAGLITVVCLVFIGFLGLPVPLLPPLF